MLVLVDNTRNRGTSGATLVQVAVVLMVLLGFSALAIDLSMVITAKNQLQTAVDSAALAGASGLIVDEQEATDRAISYAASNDVINAPVAIGDEDVSFPAEDQVQVEGNHPVDLFFARAIGYETADIAARAVAELTPLSGTSCVKPWAIPDDDYVYGDLVTLKAGQLGAPGTDPSWFYAVDFPPVNDGDPIPGASEYRDNIMYCSDYVIDIGDELQVEPGNMVGPTNQGVDYLIDQDPDAYWDGEGIAGSDYPEFTSPRVCKVPFYDISYPPDSGRNTVIVVRLGAFFLEGMQGRDLMGRFLETTTSGEPGGGDDSDLFGVRLIE